MNVNEWNVFIFLLISVLNRVTCNKVWLYVPGSCYGPSSSTQPWREQSWVRWIREETGRDQKCVMRRAQCRGAHRAWATCASEHVVSHRVDGNSLNKSNEIAEMESGVIPGFGISLAWRSPVLSLLSLISRHFVIHFRMILLSFRW